MTVPMGSFPAPVEICMLGGFRVLARGNQVNLKPGGKAQSLLAALALDGSVGLPRDQLLDTLWPSTDMGLACQSLNTLMYSLHRSLGVALDGRPPIRHGDGLYHLNIEAGVAVDIAIFNVAADAGDRAIQAGDDEAALGSYRTAAVVYRGDLVASSDVRHVIERERLRARYLGIRGRLADLRFRSGDLAGALAGALDVLSHDPCYEDAHRIAMRSYNRLGQRSQALRQYGICRDVLAAEFNAVPEPATEELYAQLRVQPSRV